MVKSATESTRLEGEQGKNGEDAGDTELILGTVLHGNKFHPVLRRLLPSGVKVLSHHAACSVSDPIGCIIRYLE